MFGSRDTAYVFDPALILVYPSGSNTLIGRQPDKPEIAAKLRIEERELEAGGTN